MKVYTKIILDKNNNVIYEDSYDYNGSILMTMGIHYDFKSLSGVRAMKKKAKIAERREKKKSKRKDKEGDEKIKIEKGLDPNKALSLDFLTNPNKKWIKKTNLLN